MLEDGQLNSLKNKWMFRELEKNSRELFRKWENIAKGYEGLLNRGPLYSDKAYTPHNFKNHCMDIYEILHKLLPEDIYIQQFNSDEIFCLLTSVTLHDVVMAFNADAREWHSRMASDFIYEELYNNYDTIMRNNLTNEHAKSIAQIILGHSDIKKPEHIKTLEILNDEEEWLSGAFGIIDVRKLASLLRIADELDVTKKRIAGIRHMHDKINEDSAPHWEVLDLFEDIKLDKDDNSIILLKTDDYLIEKTGEMETLCASINKVKNKIKNELDNVNKILKKPKHLKGWTYDKINIQTKLGEVEDILKALETTNPMENTSLSEGEKDTYTEGDFDNDYVKKNH